MTVSLDVYYDRFGVLVKPFHPQVGFNYNRVYYSKEAVIEDFDIHGWKLISRESTYDRRMSASLDNEIMTFQRKEFIVGS